MRMASWFYFAVKALAISTSPDDAPIPTVEPQPLEYAVETKSGPVYVHVWEPDEDHAEAFSDLTVVTVHPWATLGGGEINNIGIAHQLAKRGLRTITFELQTSNTIVGVFTIHSREVEEVVKVSNWAAKKYGGKVLLYGNSAGSPFAGSALDSSSHIKGIVSVGYPFGWVASVAFGGHYHKIIRSSKPKFFIQGSTDEFTSVGTFERMVNRCPNAKGLIYNHMNHFQLEEAGSDERLANNVIEFCKEISEGHEVHRSIRTVDV